MQLLPCPVTHSHISRILFILGIQSPLRSKTHRCCLQKGHIIHLQMSRVQRLNGVRWFFSVKYWEYCVQALEFANYFFSQKALALPPSRALMWSELKGHTFFPFCVVCAHPHAYAHTRSCSLHAFLHSLHHRTAMFFIFDIIFITSSIVRPRLRYGIPILQWF